MVKASRKNKPPQAPPATVYDADGRIVSAPVPAEWLERIDEINHARAVIDQTQARQVGTTPTPKTKHPHPQTDRFWRAMREAFPNGADGIPTPVIKRKLDADMKDECRRKGTRLISRSTINRNLKRSRS
jgi:hypothetical protein